MKRSALRIDRQRGVASLVVVMVLFFIISLVAAYTNRNLIFEQRTSVNQYRSTQALEAAEAGLEWAIAMLNYSRIDDQCVASTSTSSPSFRRRYLHIDDATGNITPTDTTLRPTCVLDGSNWSCRCPASGAATLPAPSGSSVAPAFRVRFEQIDPAPPLAPARAGVIRIRVAACTRLDDSCLTDTSAGAIGEGRVTVTALLGIAGRLASPPSAALTARGSVAPTGSFQVFNTDAAGSGLTVQAAGPITGVVAQSIPGTPPLASLLPNDPALNPAATPPFTADRMFAAPFGVWPATFKDQPAAVRLDCGGSNCSAEQVRDAVALNPGRPLWLQGGLSVDSAGDIGSAAAPVLLILEGNLQFATSGVTIHGLVHLRTADWTSAGSGQVRGAVIAEGNVGGAGNLSIVRDADVLNRLRVGTGSLVRLPGSWRDFERTPPL